jgi:hypothetical protein
MKVFDLKRMLDTFPSDAEVYSVWDGSARTKIATAWLARDREDDLDGGAQRRVLLAGSDDVVYDEDNLPENAIRETSQSQYWYTSQLTK